MARFRSVAITCGPSPAYPVLAELRPAPEEVRLVLAGDGIVATVVDRFASLIGLWPGDPQVQ